MADDSLSSYVRRQKRSQSKAEWASSTISDQMVRNKIEKEYAFKFLMWKRSYLLSSKNERKRMEREILNKTIEEATEQYKWSRN